MKITHTRPDANNSITSSVRSTRRTKIFADDNVFADMGADENVFGEEDPDRDDDDEATEGEDVDNLDEELDAELQQDSSAIDMDNNITNHLIAECQNCHGIFISAMIASDQIIDSINGVCPLCNKDTEQSLLWVVKDYPEDI